MRLRFKRHSNAFIVLGVATANVGHASRRGVIRMPMGDSDDGLFLFIHGLGVAPVADGMVQGSVA
jgi:hypothetical protein